MGAGDFEFENKTQPQPVASPWLEKIYTNPVFWKAIAEFFTRIKENGDVSQHKLISSGYTNFEDFKVNTTVKSYTSFKINNFKIDYYGDSDLIISYETPDKSYPVCTLYKSHVIDMCRLKIENINDFDLTFKLTNVCEVDDSYSQGARYKGKQDEYEYGGYRIYGKNEITNVFTNGGNYLQITHPNNDNPLLKIYNPVVGFRHDPKLIANAINELSIALQKKKALDDMISSVKIPEEIFLVVKQMLA